MPTAKTSPVSRDEWYDLAGGFCDFGFRHAWDFNVHGANRQGSEVDHVAVTDGDAVVGLAGVRVKRMPVIGGGIAYLGGGPLTRRGHDDDLERLSRCLTALRDDYVGSRRLVLRVSAPLVEPEQRSAYESVYLSCGFQPATHVPVYRTLLLDLASPLEQIRAGFTKRWVRGLKKGERADFDVELGTGTEMFARFRALYEQFITWKEFEVDHDARFHEAVHADLPDQARYLVLLSSHGGDLAGGLVLARTGDTAVYVLGASNPELRNLSPGHYLHWVAIQELKDRGIRWYDLGGIDPDDNEGGYVFKAGISELDVTAPGPFECGPGGLRGRLVPAAETAYRRIGHLRRSPR